MSTQKQYDEKMKLPIKKKYFDEIKSGKKRLEYRDAHITFICEETGEKIMKKVYGVSLCGRYGRFSDVCEDDAVIEFYLGD